MSQTHRLLRNIPTDRYTRLPKPGEEPRWQRINRRDYSYVSTGSSMARLPNRHDRHSDTIVVVNVRLGEIGMRGRHIDASRLYRELAREGCPLHLTDRPVAETYFRNYQNNWQNLVVVAPVHIEECPREDMESADEVQHRGTFLICGPNGKPLLLQPDRKFYCPHEDPMFNRQGGCVHVVPPQHRTPWHYLFEVNPEYVPDGI